MPANFWSRTLNIDESPVGGQAILSAHSWLDCRPALVAAADALLGTQ